MIIVSLLNTKSPSAKSEQAKTRLKVVYLVVAIIDYIKNTVVSSFCHKLFALFEGALEFRNLSPSSDGLLNVEFLCFHILFVLMLCYKDKPFHLIYQIFIQLFLPQRQFLNILNIVAVFRSYGTN